jgi:trehalose 2-sulfotransferase
MTMPRTTYLIFFTPRSGSYLLCEALTSSRLAGFPGEYFGRDQSERLGKLWQVSSQAAYIERLFRERATGNGVFGAKVTWRHFGYFIARSRGIGHCRDLLPAAVTSALLPNLHYVWLTRQDKLRQAISYAKALQTDVWSGTGPAGRERPVAQYDSESIRALLRRTREDEARIASYFSENNIEPLVVVYEEFTSRYQETCAEILNYLQVDGAERLQLQSPRLVKQADAQTEEWVHRYHEEELRADAAHRDGCLEGQ